MPDGVLVTLIKALVLANGLMAFFAFMTVFERKLIGRMQTRHGPNRVGPIGLLQPIADLGKLIRKQHVIPDGAHRRLYLAAPFISMFEQGMPWRTTVGGDVLVSSVQPSVAPCGMGLPST